MVARLFKNRRFLVVLILAIIGVAGSLVVAHQPTLLISHVKITGTKTVSAEALERVALESLAGRYLWLYPKRHAWWYSAERVIASVRASFPELSQVILEQPAIDQLHLTVTERRGEYLWCLGLQDCYFMDGEGLVFARAPQYSDHLFFEFGGRPGATPIGTTPVMAEHFNQIIALREAFGKVFDQGSLFTGARLWRVVAGEGPTDYFFLGDWPKQPERPEFKIHFSVVQEPATLVGNLRAAFGSTVFERDWRDNQGWLEYLDVRFLPKVFYKFATI